MSKKIIFCADGTWNGPDQKDDAGDLTPSNVQNLFLSLDNTTTSELGSEMESTLSGADGIIVQVAKYLHGVGDAGNKLSNFVEGSTGAGLVARLIRGYTYISRNYKPDDQIYLVGFSRGAYTARALAGLIISEGLLDWSAMKLGAGSDPNAYAAGMAVWNKHQAARHKSGPRNILGALEDLTTRFADTFTAGTAPDPLRMIVKVPIQGIAVWDTVGALGIPDYAKDGSTRLDLFDFVDTALHPSVKNGWHAVAIDEERVDFTPTLWETRAGISQVLFPGAHADVGGGYGPKECGLSDCALKWMIGVLRQDGVVFGKPAVTRIPDPISASHQPWLDEMYKMMHRAHRHFPPDLYLSQTTVERVSAHAVPMPGSHACAYRPANLSNSYYLLDWSKTAPHVNVVK
jgi:uncharacterized protein (DUF2235 family)